MSARKRGATGLSGLLLIDKPAGMTSHDVVAAVRRATGEGRVGHAGTLDPMATGLLVALVGPATRLEPYLAAADKSYVAEITFGTATDTDDAEGEIVRDMPTPAGLADPARAAEVLAGFLGDSMQQPPVYSAIKVDGQTAHRAARSGAPLELRPRPIAVTDAGLLGVATDPTRWSVEFTVSKGTYVRALARDIGEREGTAAHLSALKRTASGPLRLADAHSLDEVLRSAEEQRLMTLFADPVSALGNPQCVAADAAQVLAGRSLPRSSHVEPDELVSVLVDGGLGALYRAKGNLLVPEVVLSVPARRNA